MTVVHLRLFPPPTGWGRFDPARAVGDWVFEELYYDPEWHFEFGPDRRWADVKIRSEWGPGAGPAKLGERGRFDAIWVRWLEEGGRFDQIYSVAGGRETPARDCWYAFDEVRVEWVPTRARPVEFPKSGRYPAGLHADDEPCENLEGTPVTQSPELAAVRDLLVYGAHRAELYWKGRLVHRVARREVPATWELMDGDTALWSRAWFHGWDNCADEAYAAYVVQD
jgi:hypothetical protein